jgi:hypothetical protein
VDLRVPSPEAIGFQPRALFAAAATLCCRLADMPPFVVAAAASGFASPAALARVVAVGTRIGVLPSEGAVSLATLARLADDIAAQQRREREEVLAAGSPPDELLDPLLCTLMTDPVRTPSGHVFDRHRCVM